MLLSTFLTDFNLGLKLFFFLFQIDPKVAFPRRAHPKVRRFMISFDINTKWKCPSRSCNTPGTYLNICEAELHTRTISSHICLHV